MKNLTTKFIVLMIMIISIGINQGYSQLGNLNSLKNKASKLKKKKKKDKSSSSSNTYTTNSYSKYMNDGRKFSDEKKYVEAYTAFSNALKEKPGDYSAKQEVDYSKKEVKTYFFDKITKDISENNCTQAETDLADAIKVLETWYQEKYFKGEIAKCKENAGANVTAADNKAKIDALKDGSANFYTDYAKKDFSPTISVGDDLFVKFKFAKVMTDYFSELGIEQAYNAYGYFTLYINGKKIFTDGPYQFTSNYSKVWRDMDVPLSASKDFMLKLKANPKLLATNQDIWMLQQVSNPTGINSKYIMAAIQNMPNDGTYKVKLEFGLGEKEDGKPKGTIASGEVNIKVDAAGKKELYKRGPKYLQPLEDNERGEFTFSNNSYTLGSGNLNVTLNLPQPPKYYNMKWCQSMSCDYDHGELMFAVFLDNNYLASWSSTLWNNDYETNKSFATTIFTPNDKELNNDLAKFNSSILFKKVGNDNPVVYALYDLLYANKLSVGKHQLKFKVISPESVPPELTFSEDKEYYEKLNTIAENTLTFNVASSTRSKLIGLSSAHKLKHVGGVGQSVDTKLKTNTSTDGLATIIDVATYNKWKVTVNYLGTPLYRKCGANVLYKSKDGFTRLLKYVEVTEDYQGNGKYGSPYFPGLYNSFRTSSGFLNSSHYPVPYNKVK